MSEKQARQQRRQQRRDAYERSHQSSVSSPASGLPPSPPPPVALSSSDPSPFSSSLLAISLQAAVPLRVLACYERGGPTSDDLATAQRFGAVLAERGDRLLYRGEKPGETAALFNQIAEAIAILAFVPGGIPSLFGQRFEAETMLASFIGTEQARAYCQRVRTQSKDASTFQEKPDL